ncbi:thiaminase II [candidate division KSB1 bacterium]|nr:thiaminase II [candidate division KSB1 bacterium]
MSRFSFYEKLRKKNDMVWQSILDHPFVKGIGDGSLSHQKYEYFLKQDYYYLIQFSRLFALAAAKAPTLEEMNYMSALLQATLSVEMDIHRRTCRKLGISAEDLEKIEPAMITMSYTNLLVRTCYEGSFADIIAVLLPCATGYVEIGKKLKAQGLPDDPFYQDWIKSYSSDEFQEFADWLIDKMDSLAENASDTDVKRWQDYYLASARFEYLFFDMSWKMEFWEI